METYSDQPIHVDLFAKGHDPFGQNNILFSGSGENKQIKTVNELGLPSKYLTNGDCSAKITMVDGYIQSKDYVENVSGWRLNADGTSDIN